MTPARLPDGFEPADHSTATAGALCACGCGRAVPADGPSLWFATQICQRRWNSALATKPNEVYAANDQVAVDPTWADHIAYAPFAADAWRAGLFRTVGR